MIPKTVARRNRKLLDMARDKPCMLIVPDVCCGDFSTTVAAHSNWSEHGKGGARKADDHYTVWACATCHAWLDTSGASAEEKRAVWDRAHATQVDVWQAMAERGDKAAQWAVDQLGDVGK